MNNFRLLGRQPKRVVVQAINLLSNTLADDFVSSSLRKVLFRSLGARFGTGTTINGGGYLHGGDLTTGSGYYINRGCYFDFTGRTTLGNNVVAEYGTTFIIAQHKLGSSRRRAGAVYKRLISVEEGAWIDANATILPGVAIGRGAVIDAGFVVISDVPRI